MTDAFIGEVRQFAGSYAPRGWAFCDGQLLPIASNTALFSILGTLYGGDGRTTFALPDLRERVAVGAGHGPGLSTYREGQRGGNSQVQLNAANLPSHSHTVNGFTDAPTAQSPENASYAGTPTYEAGESNLVNMAPNALASTGNSTPFDTQQPFTYSNYIICLSGIYPPRG